MYLFFNENVKVSQKPKFFCEKFFSFKFFTKFFIIFNLKNSIKKLNYRHSNVKLLKIYYELECFNKILRNYLKETENS
jgi:hypothetical protein